MLSRKESDILWYFHSTACRDIFPILRQPNVLTDLVDLMADHVKSLNVDVVVGVEARGFLFGPLICSRLSLPFVPIRKKGKLPGQTVRMSYELEYGTVRSRIKL